MHIHLPKPLHGLREFLHEVAIIVFGVLIALGAEQLVENWRWHERTGAAIEALRNESAGNFGIAAEQVTVDPCVKAQLGDLHDRLTGSGGATLPAPVFTESGYDAYVIRHPSRPWTADVWRSVNSDGTAAHLDYSRHSLLSSVYAQVATMLDMNAATDATGQRLSVLDERLALDPATRTHFLEMIADQRGRTALQTLIASQVMGHLRDVAQMPDGRSIDQYLGQSGTVAFCRRDGLPLGDWRKILAAVPSDR